jgi:predicted RNA-binding protein with PUA-like domain
MTKADDDKARPRGWLLKTEPDSYSFKDLQREGKTVWDGVTNNLALRNIRNIRKGDQVLIYHTGNEKTVAGLAEAASPPYPDPKANDPKLVVVDVKPKKPAAKPVTLGDIKQLPDLASSDLVRLPRLSVVPLTEKQWNKITQLAGL